MSEIKSVGKFSTGFINPITQEEQFRELTELEREILGILKTAEKWSASHTESNKIIDANIAAKRISKWLTDRPRSEQSLPEAFTSQPVSFLLTNALRLPVEQQVALRDALIERTPKEQSFSREEVVELLEGVYHEMSIFKNKKDGKKWVEEFLDNKLNTH